jgi:hypothetical protein
VAAKVRWFFWSEDVGPEVVDTPFFSDFVDGRWRILVQDSKGTPLGPRATWACTSLFIDSQSLVGDGAFLGSCNDEGSASLLVSVSAALEFGGGRCLRLLQETLRIVLYFLIFRILFVNSG